MMERVIEAEWLDTLAAQNPGAVNSRRDLERLNAWMGNARRVATVLGKARKPGAPCRVADLGGGDARFFLRAAQLVKTPGVGQVTIVDQHHIVSPQTEGDLAQLGWRLEIAQADVFAWLGQQNEREWDLMVANLFLHHFSDAQLQAMLAQASNVTGIFVALEPHRSRLALAFSRCVRLIGCNYVTRHDAPASVRAGFSGKDLSGLWLADENWVLEEHQAGWFGHMFVARLPGHQGTGQTSDQTRPTEKGLASAQ